MAYYQQPYGNPYGYSYGGGYPAGAGMMAYQPQPMMMQRSSLMMQQQVPMMQQAPMMMTPTQPMMAAQPVMPGMGASRQGSSARCMAICNIVCSVIMIVGAIIGILLPFATLFPDQKDYPAILWEITAGISGVSLLIYAVNLGFACSILSASRMVGPGSAGKATGWICTQVLALLIEVALLGVSVSYRFYYVGSEVIAGIVHCVGICIACQFRVELQSGTAAVAPVPVVGGGVTVVTNNNSAAAGYGGASSTTEDDGDTGVRAGSI